MADNQSLPDAEMDVLAFLWRSGEVTARDIREGMAAYRPLTHSAVCTLLTRLQDKGQVTRRKGTVGKAFLYRAANRPKRTQRRVINTLLERVFGGDSFAVVASLFETRPPTKEELDRLQELLDELRTQESPASKKGRQK